MRITCAYFETFWNEPRKPAGKDKYQDLRVAADLPLGLATCRAFAQRSADTAGKLKFINKIFTDTTPEKKVAAEILKTKPDVVAFSLFLWNAPRTVEVAKLLKAAKKPPLIVVGGPEVPRKGNVLKQFLKERPSIDIAVCGEGEETFSHLLDALVDDRPLAEIEGLGFRHAKRIIATKPRGPIDDLARIPSPYSDGAALPRKTDRGMVCVESSRGCPMECSYCDYHAGRRKMRLFPIERLRKELKSITDSGFKGCIYLTDPYLNVKKERALEVFGELRKWDNRFLMELMAETFDDESLAALGAIPAATISLGIQTINPDALENVKRRFNLTRCTDNIRKLVGYQNLQIELEFILGLPGDDYDSFKRTVDWALQFTPAASFTLFDLVMLPNAPLAEKVEEFKITTDEEGLVTSSYSFSEEDMAKSSWLFVAYRYLRETPGCWERFAALAAAGRRPSNSLEKVGRQLIQSGFIPAERIVGQGGRRKSRRLSKDGKSTRWVDLSPCPQGVEAEAWW